MVWETKVDASRLLLVVGFAVFLCPVSGPLSSYAYL